MGAEKVSNGGRSTRHANLNKQLHNTKLCVYFQQGSCKYGAKCVFAHEQDDVAPLPDLAKTRMCAKFEAGKCQNENCMFAHSHEELRSTDYYFKTILCTWHAAGKCRNGTNCRFAHGEAELRKSLEGNGKNAIANHTNGTKKQTADQPAKQAAKANSKEQLGKASSKKGSAEKEAKESNSRRAKPKESAITGDYNPMFIQPTDPTLMQSSVSPFLSSSTLADYQQLPSYGDYGLMTGMGLGLTQPQAAFSPYAASYTPASQLPVAATSGGLSEPGLETMEIAALSASIKSLSGQIRQLQKHIAPVASTNEVKAGESETTKSGSGGSYSRSQSSGDSSPPSTPPMQHGAFSRSDVERLKWQLHLAAMAQGMFLGHSPNYNVQGM